MANLFTEEEDYISRTVSFVHENAFADERVIYPFLLDTHERPRVIDEIKDRVTNQMTREKEVYIENLRTRFLTKDGGSTIIDSIVLAICEPNCDKVVVAQTVLQDIETVMCQAQCTPNEAVDALVRNQSNLVDAITELIPA